MINLETANFMDKVHHLKKKGAKIEWGGKNLFDLPMNEMRKVIEGQGKDIHYFHLILENMCKWVK